MEGDADAKAYVAQNIVQMEAFFHDLLVKMIAARADNPRAFALKYLLGQQALQGECGSRIGDGVIVVKQDDPRCGQRGTVQSAHAEGVKVLFAAGDVEGFKYSSVALSKEVGAAADALSEHLPAASCVDADKSMPLSSTEGVASALAGSMLKSKQSATIDEAVRCSRSTADAPTDAPVGDEWKVKSWLSDVTAAPVAEALLRPLGEAAPAHAVLEYLRTLGKDRQALRSLLDERLLDDLADVLSAAASGLSAETSAEALSRKFTETTFTLTFESRDSFYAGLEGRLGAPNPKLRETMRHDHCSAADAREPFVTRNYGVSTTSETEWWFVVDPSAGLAELGLTSWPAEAGRDLPAALQRAAEPLEAFELELRRVNKTLSGLKEPGLLEEELIAGRLYTGPMYQKYNLVLRAGVGASAAVREEFAQTCKGNCYVTTLHVLNSCIVKLSKLSICRKVYRGMANGVLPDSFWHADAYGVRGGVEAAFMSASADRSVAASYASGGGAGLVLELEQGMVNRGAELSWLSQYKHEEEVLFAPLTGIELRRTRVEGRTIVAELGLSVNLVAPTIEEVVGRRAKMLTDMQRNMQLELAMEWGARWTASQRAACVSIFAFTEQSTEWFNEDDNFRAAVAEALRAKRRAFSLAALQQCKAFSAMATDEQLLFADAFDDAVAEAGVTVIAEGSACRLTIIRAGEAEVRVGGRVVAHRVLGAMVGDQHMITGEPAKASIIAKGKLLLMQMTRDTYLDIVSRMPPDRVRHLQLSIQADYDARMAKWLAEDPDATKDDCMKRWLSKGGEQAAARLGSRGAARE